MGAGRGTRGPAPLQREWSVTRLARFMREDTRSTPKVAAIDARAPVRALSMPTRRGFAQSASDGQAGPLREEDAGGLDIDTAAGINQA